MLLVFVSTSFYATAQQAVITNENEHSSDQNKEEENSADDDHFPIDFSGSVDTYFRSNIGADFGVDPGTSFANLPGFSLGMANLIASHDGEKAGVVADLVFGPRGEDATFLSSDLRPIFGNSSSIVNQLFAYYNISDNVTATLGNFNTYLGYEVISPTGNFNYSTSYMFSNGPFSHTGLKVDASLSDSFTVMAGVFNPTDATEYNPIDEYAYGTQLGYSEGGLSVFVNGLFADDYTQGDITAGYDISDNTYFGLNATIAEDLFSGVAGYLQQTLSEHAAIGARVESFKFEEADESILDITLSAPLTKGNFTVIPELRLDAYGEDIVPNDGELDSSLASFVLAAVYGF
mgnify:CR=1 FL=1